jgi:hypothetical protein
MDDPIPPPTGAPAPDPGEPAADPGERRLSRPPSDRYRQADAATEDPAGTTASPARGVVLAVFAAIGAALAITVLGGVTLVSAGLVVVAAAGGWAVAIALRLGAGPTIPRRSRIGLAVALALGAVVLGQVGLWLFARNEGGVLPIADFLAQTYGPLVPLQAVAAAVAAGWTAR